VAEENVVAVAGGAGPDHGGRVGEAGSMALARPDPAGRPVTERERADPPRP
jgi:hypothetical protein